jgi:fructose-1,6-bisphosphatase/inositol monophosphatase family enzyme
MTLEDPSPLDKILQVAQEAALIAGVKIRQTLISSDNVKLNMKSSSADLVTETDEECEQVVMDKIQSSFPEHKIIGEESSGSDKYELTDAPTWTIDPIVSLPKKCNMKEI